MNGRQSFLETQFRVRIIYNNNDGINNSSYNVYFFWFMYNKNHLRSYSDVLPRLFSTLNLVDAYHQFESCYAPSLLLKLRRVEASPLSTEFGSCKHQISWVIIREKDKSSDILRQGTCLYHLLLNKNIHTLHVLWLESKFSYFFTETSECHIPLEVWEMRI